MGVQGAQQATYDAAIADGKITKEEFDSLYPDGDFSRYDTDGDNEIALADFDADGDGTTTLDEFSKGVAKNAEQPSNTISGAQVLTESDLRIFSMLCEADAILDYLMEKIQTAANTENENADGTGGADGFTREEYEQLIADLKKYWEQYANNGNGEMGKEDFRAFLTAMNQKYGWNLDDTVIDNMCKELYGATVLGINWVTKTADEVISYLQQEGLVPTGPDATTDAGGTEGYTAEAYEKLIEELKALYDSIAPGNLSDKMNGEEFKEFLKAVSVKLGLNLTDEDIQNFRDAHYPAIVGANKTWEEVLGFIKADGVIPSGPTATQAPVEKSDTSGGTDEMTPEEYDKMMEQLELWYRQYGNNDGGTTMGKKDFIAFMKKANSTYNWGLSDTVIENFAKELFGGSFLGMNWKTRSFDEVKSFLIEKGIIPATRPEVTEGTGGTGDTAGTETEDEFEEDTSRSKWYNGYKRKIDSVSDFSSSSMGLWVSNLVNKITTFISTLVSAGKASNDFAEEISKKSLP